MSDLISRSALIKAFEAEERECEDAVEIIPSFVDTENDRYLEYDLQHRR